MAVYDVTELVVWERANKLGKWCPYSADVCQFLEKNHRRDNTSIVKLGEVDETLEIFSINFKDMVQISEATGTKLPIRRRQTDSMGALGRGFSWQFQDDDKTWNSYDVDVNNFIDCAFLEGKKSISLGRKFPGYHYEIVFTKMIQINKHTKRKRKIRRFEITMPYPMVTNVEEVMDVDNKNVHLENQEILSPQFLQQEIPGTKDLENQVNAYKRNVEGFASMKNGAERIDDNDCSNHSKCNPTDETQEGNSQLEQSSSVFPTTVALVNGMAWSDSRPPHTPRSKLKPVPGIDPLPMYEKPKKKRRNDNPKSYVDEVNILERYTEVTDLSEVLDGACIICCESLSAKSSYDDSHTLSKLTLCSHVFHKACLEAMYNSSNKEFLQCPSCKKIHGEKRGMQPPGEMIYHVLPYSLPSYPQHDTIRIIYDIHSGIQGEEHPNPGKRYTARGFPRHCYLPDNEIGRKILRLLVKAWKRRLIFTIGQSSTTGEDNTVTWNEIHHKTEFGCNRRGHGYPDPNYFNNVLAELEAHGVIDDDVHVWSSA